MTPRERLELAAGFICAVACCSALTLAYCLVMQPGWWRWLLTVAS